MHLPAEARIVEFDRADGLGTLELNDGTRLRFGGSACTDFVPVAGARCFVIETREDPIRGGLRAKVVNQSGAKEADRITQGEQAREQRLQQKEAEKQLLASLGLDRSSLNHRAVLALSDADANRAAAELMRMKRGGAFFDDLFSVLVEARPSVFHPFLGELDPKREPESLAFVDAPFESVSRFAGVLDSSDDSPLQVEREVGTIARRIDAHRDGHAASNEVGGALLALARACEEESHAAIERWAQRASNESRVAAHRLLAEAGFGLSAEGQVLWLHLAPAYSLRPIAPKSAGLLARVFGSKPVEHESSMYGRSESICLRCQQALTTVMNVKLPAEHAESLRSERLTVLTCRNCVPLLDAYFVKPAPSGDFAPVATEELMALAEAFSPPALPASTAVDLEPAPLVAGFLHAEAGELSRVGGLPSWAQDLQLPACPSCGVLMVFVAQAGDPPGSSWVLDPSILLAFRCHRCGTIGTVAQRG